MTVLYQQVPVTLDPYTAIPDGAPLSSGLSEAGAAEVIAASEAFTAETAVGLAVTYTGPFAVEATLEPVADFEEDFGVQWSWGDGRYETGGLTAAHVYASWDSSLFSAKPSTVEGGYLIEAVVTQPGQASFALDVVVRFDDAGSEITAS